MSKKHENNCKRLPKWSRNRCQNASKINARTGIEQKTRKLIKNHVSLKSEIIEIHWKNNGFWWFRRLHVRTVKVPKKIQNVTKFHPKFNEKSIQKTCSKKESQNMKTYPKSDPKMEPKSIKNHSKNRCEKRDEKRRFKFQVGERVRTPNQSFQKTSFGVRCEERYTKKVEWGVSTRWSAKSEVQRESAERQVQTGNQQRT